MNAHKSHAPRPDYPAGLTVTITLPNTPAEVYAAVIDPRSWWSRGIVGNTSRVGDEFDYRYLDVHRCRVRVIQAAPIEHVTWEVVDNSFNFVEDDTEWIGSHASFHLTPDGDSTRLTFIHHGLVPEWECYEACSQGWRHYIGESLRDLIVTGTGQPNDEGTAHTEFERGLRGSTWAGR